MASATCISARPNQEEVAALLSPNIKKCGCPKRVIVNVRVLKGTRVATATSVSRPRRNQRVHKEGRAMNRSSSPRHHHFLMETDIFTPPPAGLIVIKLTDVHGNSFVNLFRTVCLEVAHFLPFPSSQSLSPLRSASGSMSCFRVGPRHTPASKCRPLPEGEKIYRQVTGLCAISSIAFLNCYCGREPKPLPQSLGAPITAHFTQ